MIANPTQGIDVAIMRRYARETREFFVQELARGNVLGCDRTDPSNPRQCLQSMIPGHLTEEVGKPIWQLCLVSGCVTHKKDKDKYGFHTATTTLNVMNDTYENRGYETYMAIPVWINGTQVIALIDTGAARSFISREVVRRAGIPTQQKNDPYPLVTATGKEMPGASHVTETTVHTELATQQHRETLRFDVLEIATHDVILGIPWLRKHNPVVDWRTKQLRFEDGSLVRAWIPGELRDEVTDENTRSPYLELCAIQGSKQEHVVTMPASTGSERESPTDHEVRSQGGSDRSSIPTEYQKWSYLFEEGAPEKALPKHQPWDHEIPLVEGKTPTFGPIYQMSEFELKTLDEYLKVNLAKGFIRPSSLSAGYPILFVPKKNGKLRLCVDYRKLNEITIKNRYPLPNANELRDRLAGAKWFTKLDMRGAYNLIRMKAGHEWKTAFRTRYGSYEYMVMPFGLTNAPASCQGLVNNVLRNLLDQCVIAYLDDILVYSKTLDDHRQHVTKVLTCLAAVDLKLEPEKCEFHQKVVDFLGYVVTTEGIKADPEKVKALLEWPRPTNVKELQSFLGTINFNRRFIRGFSQLALPLTKLTRKDTLYEWSKDQQQAFQRLKEACTTTPTLRTFESGKPIRIETDASDTATGACLLQQHDGAWHPVAYYSRKMTDPEQNYDIHDKELLAIVLAFQQWRVYAEGATDIEVLTDHKNLIYFTTTKQLNRRQVRWSELLGQHKFKITYSPGKDNQAADGLSRRPDLYNEKHETNMAILKMNADRSLAPNQLNTISIGSTRELLKEVEQAYEGDKLATKWIAEKRKLPLTYMGNYYLLESKMQEFIGLYHDDPFYGHPGVTRTFELVNRHLSSPGMRTAIENCIQECPSCMRNKAESHKKYGYLQKIELPQFPWTSITMDFITKFPPSMDPTTKEVYDSIMVVVDRHTKYSTIIPFREEYNTVQLAYLFLDKVVKIRRFPEEIISDRDKLFTSAYWKTITGESGVKVKLSTAYHPQTDGQTERTNRTLKTYLRHYVNAQQDNWVPMLPLAEISMNNLISAATGTTPFYANYGRHPRMLSDPKPHPKAESAIKLVQDLKQVHQQVQSQLEIAQTKMENQENRHRTKGPQLKEEDKVWLHTKNLRTKRPSKKLDHVRVGPFVIKKVKGPVNYELELPEDAKVHPVFHISLLEKASDREPTATTFQYESQEDDLFEVEAILDQRNDQYLIKWKGYPDTENIWEPEHHLLPSSAKLLRKFRQRRNGASQ